MDIRQLRNSRTQMLIYELVLLPLLWTFLLLQSEKWRKKIEPSFEGSLPRLWMPVLFAISTIQFRYFSVLRLARVECWHSGYPILERIQCVITLLCNSMSGYFCCIFVSTKLRKPELWWTFLTRDSIALSIVGHVLT